MGAHPQEIEPDVASQEARSLLDNMATTLRRRNVQETKATESDDNSRDDSSTLVGRVTQSQTMSSATSTSMQPRSRSTTTMKRWIRTRGQVHRVSYSTPCWFTRE